MPTKKLAYELSSENNIEIGRNSRPRVNHSITNAPIIIPTTLTPIPNNVDMLIVPKAPGAVFDEGDVLVVGEELELLGAVDEDRGPEDDKEEDDSDEVVDEDNIVEDSIVEGNDIDVLVLATAQNCSASDSASDSSEGHCPAIQETNVFVKFPRLKQ